MSGGVPGSLVGEWIVDVFLRSTNGPARIDRTGLSIQRMPAGIPSDALDKPCPARRVSGSRCLLGVPNAQTARRTRGNGVVLRTDPGVPSQ